MTKTSTYKCKFYWSMQSKWIIAQIVHKNCILNLSLEPSRLSSESCLSSNFSILIFEFTSNKSSFGWNIGILPSQSLYFQY